MKPYLERIIIAHYRVIRRACYKTCVKPQQIIVKECLVSKNNILFHDSFFVVCLFLRNSFHPVCRTRSLYVDPPANCWTARSRCSVIWYYVDTLIYLSFSHVAERARLSAQDFRRCTRVHVVHGSRRLENPLNGACWVIARLKINLFWKFRLVEHRVDIKIITL